MLALALYWTVISQIGDMVSISGMNNGVMVCVCVCKLQCKQVSPEPIPTASYYATLPRLVRR